jgi:nitric oxide reductase subunit C
LGGCAVLVILLLCALVVNAVYWTNRMGVFAQAPDPAAVSSITSESLPPGNAADGETLFRGDAACFACHSLEPDAAGVGPSLAGIASRAATAKPDATAEGYILESIIDPDAHVAEGFSGGIMPPNFGQRLDQQQLADLLAFLMTQE